MSIGSFVSRAPNFTTPRYPMAGSGDVGGKGAGILSLPSSWYPPTIFISPRLHEMARAGGDWRAVLGDTPRLNDALSNLGAATSTEKVLVRSSARAEGIESRGTFLSIDAEPTLAGLLNSIEQIWTAAEDDEDSVGFALQPAVAVLLKGHLSNEHRVSRESMQWVMECMSTVSTWRVTNSPTLDDVPLVAKSTAAMESALRKVARTLSLQTSRHHLEWVWDGNRLWIVQADPVAPTFGPPPGDCWIPPRASPVVAASLKTWTQLDRSNLAEFIEWPKVRSVHSFREAGLSVPLLWFLRGDVLETARPHASVDAIDEDLELLCDGYLIVRTDVKFGGEASLLLPKKEVVSDAATIRKWLETTLDNLSEKGVHSSDVAFIAHRYLRSRAAAWSRASPTDPNVRIDSTWGLADGLAWLPHDTAWVNVDTRNVRRSIKGKTEFLDVIDANSWDYRSTPTEWIWRSSASEQNLLEIAVSAKRLADQQNAPVTTMWFVGMLEGVDAEILAWYQAPSDQSSTADEPSPRATRIDVNDLASLATLDLNSVEASESVVRISPTSDLVRSSDFVAKVIDKFRGTTVNLEIVGSPLAHPYYLMRKAGLKVTCRPALDPQVVSHNKLVRDRVVERIEERGESAISFEVSGRARANLLRRKLVEEALEVLAAKTIGEEAEELADVEEVLLALRSIDQISPQDVEELRLAKRGRAGGFAEGYVLVATGTAEQDDPGELDLPGMSGVPRRLDADTIAQNGAGVTLSLIPPGPSWSAIAKIGQGRFRIEYRGTRVAITPADHHVHHLQDEPFPIEWPDDG